MEEGVGVTDVPANFDDSRISQGLRHGKSAVAITMPLESKKMLMMQRDVLCKTILQTPTYIGVIDRGGVNIAESIRRAKWLFVRRSLHYTTSFHVSAPWEPQQQKHFRLHTD